MADHIGTPLQCIKFAFTLFDNPGDVAQWLRDWNEGDTRDWTTDGKSGESGEQPGWRISYADFCAANPDHPETTAADGSVRKAYYGSGEQPWDIIKRFGWAADFAAGNVLKYLRRTKGEPGDVTKARWYWVELKKLADNDYAFARAAVAKLLRELKGGDLAKLEDDAA